MTLAARELVRPVRQPVPEADSVQRDVGALTALAYGHAAIEQGCRDVVAGREGFE